MCVHACVCVCVCVRAHAYTMSYSCLPIQDDKVCVISVIGKSCLDSHLSKATIINSVIDSNAFLVCVLCHYCECGFS